MGFNIAIVTPNMIIGGAETYTIVKSRFLINAGYRVIVISSGGENVKNLPKEVKHFEIKDINTPPFAITESLRKKIEMSLIEIFKQNNINLIETHNTYPVYYCSIASLKTNIPCLYNLLNENSHKRQFVTNSIIKSYSKLGLYFTLTTQMNAFVEKQINCKLSPTIIPIPIEQSTEYLDTKSQNYILTVSRFSEDKMYLLYLIEGYRNAVEKGRISSEYKLKIVGDGELRSNIERAAKGIDGIELLGFVKGQELEILYNHCTLYVGMGTTLLLAAMRAKPIVNVGFISPDNQFALGYWGERPERDADCIVGILNDDKQEFSTALEVLNNTERLRILGEKSKKLFDSKYHFITIMNAWLKSYNDIANSGVILHGIVIWRIKLRIFFLRTLWKLKKINRYKCDKK